MEASDPMEGVGFMTNEPFLCESSWDPSLISGFGISETTNKRQPSNRNSPPRGFLWGQDMVALYEYETD